MACSADDSQDYDNQDIKGNKFTDLNLQKIYDLQNQRNTNLLLKHLTSKKAKYRDAAALAFATVQDSAAVPSLMRLLKNDKSRKVRISAAFAIGQTHLQSAQYKLIELFKTEKSDTVKFYIAEAIGKCGDTLGLDFFTSKLKNNKLKNTQEKAIFAGIARFFIRGIFTQKSLETLINYIDNQKVKGDNLYIASIALAKAKRNTISNYNEKLIRIYKGSNNIFTKMNIVNAISKNSSQTNIDFIKNIVNGDCDYRLKVNVINSFANLQKKEANKLLIKLLQDKNPNVSIRASEFILANGEEVEVDDYLLASQQIDEWRTRANLLAAALKYSSNKTKISNIIKQQYEKAENKYEKAHLLAALGYDISNYKYVGAIIHHTNDCLIATYGTEAIEKMCNNPEFEAINKRRMAAGKKDLKLEFAYILKSAVMSKDISRVAIAAGIIRNCKQDFAKKFDNTYFLTQALNNCELPKDLEAYIELQKTIAFVKGEKFVSKNNTFKKADVDWNFISKIPDNQRIKIKTNKGNITIQCNVNEAPVSVSNFLKLAKNKFFNNKYIHRVVPNFVVQDGCPRGDGWGSPDYTIYSEFPRNNYTEGSVGMASAGKDTEASQWFITHSPTPHLDGRYTNFGKVVNGMEVVHNLKVGDKIIECVVCN